MPQTPESRSRISKTATAIGGQQRRARKIGMMANVFEQSLHVGTIWAFSGAQV